MELQPAAQAPDSWLRRHVAGLACCTLGLIAAGVVAAVHAAADLPLTDLPDWRLSVPLLVATIAAAAVSLARREGQYWLCVAGVAAAAAATVLGWVLLIGLVVAVTAIVIAIVSAVS